MRLLLDNNLSPRLVPLLAAAAADVVNVGAMGLARGTDTDVLGLATSGGFATRAPAPSPRCCSRT
jgi:predicted nuclease of predicted toxin-antitoxin system